MKGPGPSSRRQERTELTRARLIQSAEKIFARDGFEAAKLEEIAANAGYTRGAFYANFKNKEDLFFALLEGEISSRIEKARNQDRPIRGPGGEVAAPCELSFWTSAWIAAGVCWRWNSNYSPSVIPK